MITLRKSQDRGYADHGWLKSHHTFSFAGYSDPKFMGFGPLRVINEDRIEGGTGFGKHVHNDMEIISYVLSGALQHEDSMGNKAVIKPGEVQKMSAGTGVQHSEINQQANEPAHFFQIWIIPDQRGIAPGYGQKSFEDQLNTKPLVLVTSKDGRDGSISIQQDADMYISRTKANQVVDFNVRPGRKVWLQVAKGKLKVNGKEISTGDGAAITDEPILKVESLENSELILFDLA